MPCKYYGNAVSDFGQQIEGEKTPRIKVGKGCQLGRQPNVENWDAHCEFTQYNGPCWFWQMEHPGAVDTEFRGE